MPPEELPNTPQQADLITGCSCRATRPSIVMLIDILVLFPITNLVIIQLSLLVGVPLSASQTILSLPVCFFMAYRWQPRRSLRELLIAACLFFALGAVAVILSTAFVDAYYDSRSYHGPAVIALSDGWNPVHQPHLCQWDADYCVPTHTIIDHYPKGQWYIAAGLYSIFGDIDTAKSFGLLQLVLCLLVSREFAKRLLPGRSIAPLVWATVVAANPVAVAQLFSGYVDGLMASTLTVYALLLSSHLFSSDRKPLFQAALVLPYLVNIKFTGLVYAAVFTGLLVVAVVLRRERSPWRLLSITLASGAVSVAVLGFNPYVVNLVEKSNPFYPARQGSLDVVRRQGDPGFMAKTRIEKFVIAQFSVPDEERPKSPVWSVPLSRPRMEIEVDSRFSGFGPLFSAVLVVSVMQAFGMRNRRVLCLVLIVTATVFSTSACWWARLAPQLWLAVALIQLDWFERSRRRWAMIIVGIVMAAMVINSSMLGGGIWRRQRIRSVKLARNLNDVRVKGLPITISDNPYGLFGFYNRRKVIDWLGDDARIVEECEWALRNRIFAVCRQ